MAPPCCGPWIKRLFGAGTTLPERSRSCGRKSERAEGRERKDELRPRKATGAGLKSGSKLSGRTVNIVAHRQT